MAAGQMQWFVTGLHDLGLKKHNLDSDDLRLAIVTNAAVPTPNTPAPHFGGTGSTDFSASEVSTNGIAYTGPIALANASWTIVNGVPTLRADPIHMDADPSGFTNAAYGIIFNNSDPYKCALAFIELSQAGNGNVAIAPYDIDWAGANNDLLRLALTA